MFAFVCSGFCLGPRLVSIRGHHCGNILKPIIDCLRLLSAQMSKMLSSDLIYDGHFNGRKSLIDRT